MFSKFKSYLIILLVSIVGLWIGIKTLNYFTHSSLPEIRVQGLQKDGYYAGQIDFDIKSENSYKVDSGAVFLDGKKLDISGLHKVSRKVFSIPVGIDILDLEDGKHVIDIEVADASYNRNINKEKFDFYVDNVALKAAFIQQEYKVDQGKTIHVRIQANKKLLNAKIRFLEKFYYCYPESDYSNVYECFIPIECEQDSGDYMFFAELQDFVKNNIKLTGKTSVKEYKFPRQKGFVIAKGKLEEEKEISMSHTILEQALEKWLEDSPGKKLWLGKFVLPINVTRVSTPFGEIRTTQERGYYLHKGVDILNTPESVVWASQDGRVIIKDRFLITGNTVVIDHGIGVFTIYQHLEDFSDIEVGDSIKKGNPIGRLGMTGYANGYHLHWELRVNNVAVDPFQWTKKTF